jgi:hypothetical protein
MEETSMTYLNTASRPRNVIGEHQIPIETNSDRMAFTREFTDQYAFSTTEFMY